MTYSSGGSIILLNLGYYFDILFFLGAGLIVYQIFIYRPVHKYLGSVNSCRAASVGA